MDCQLLITVYIVGQHAVQNFGGHHHMNCQLLIAVYIVGQHAVQNIGGHCHMDCRPRILGTREWEGKFFSFLSVEFIS